MIKFFRKIRQKLVSENRFTKYMIYALGELLLVVIGILIALQINNWNQENHDINEESKYLRALIEEADASILSLNHQNDIGEKKLEAINFIIRTLDHKLKEINSDSLNWALGKTMFLSQFQVFNTTYSELKSSGKLGLIRSDSIRKQLIDYHENIEVVNTVVDMGPNYHWKTGYAPFMDKHFNTSQIVKNWSEDVKLVYKQPEIEWNIAERTISKSMFWSLEKDDALKLEFNNILTRLYSGEWFLIHARNHLIEQTKRIRDMMEEQLESK